MRGGRPFLGGHAPATRRDAAGRQALADDLVAFLRTFDLAYRARRLRFETDGLSAWYVHAGEPGYPTRTQLDERKRMLWEARELLVAAMDGRKLFTNMTADMLGVFAQAPVDAWFDEGRGPAGYAAARSDELARLKQEFGETLDARLAGTTETLYTRLFGLSEGWAPEARRPARPLPRLPVLGRPDLPAPVGRRRRRAGHDRRRPHEPPRREAAAPGSIPRSRSSWPVSRRCTSARSSTGLAARTTTSGAASTARSV